MTVNQPAIASAPTWRPAEPAGDGEACAAFVIDADGNVVASNATAREWWRVEKRPWMAASFAGLFAPADGDAENSGLAARWMTLKAQAAQRWFALNARPYAGADFAVRVRVERAFGGGGSYIAVVQTARTEPA